ncbi:S1 family peptidase [Ornithinicoccus hortensis]|uniref:Trypsin-like peptidase n=1 Tax=Ornithinicoccus hortensis TaxID=82346 RepID=A0A542YQW2_9MICO|nr:serine protease [Ornithinicoccus hortensis]TQL50459.1 trypsin-like peptidase [Ornithinicoccus hortensis]
MRTTQLQALTTTALLAGALVVPAAASASETGARSDANASIVWVDVEFPATVEVPWEDGTSTLYSTDVLALCTGFFVSDDGEIVTASHCVEADATTERAAVGQVAGDLQQEGYDLSHLDLATLDWAVGIGEPTAYVGQPTGIADGIFSGSDSMIAQIVDSQGFAKGDNALLRVADLADSPALPISEDTPVVGDPVTSIGFAGSVSDVSDYRRQLPSYKFGTVSSRQYTTKGVPNTEIDAAVTGGMSGGPTLDESGAVIGVNSFGIHGESQPFNFVTDTETLRDFLTRNGVDVAEAAAPSEETATAAEVAVTVPQEGTGHVATDQGSLPGAAADGGAADTATPVSLSDGPAAPPAAADEAGLPAVAWASIGLAGLLLLLGGGLGGRYLARSRSAA